MAVTFSIATYLLYLGGPLDWPASARLLTTIVVVVSQVAFFLGFVWSGIGRSETQQARRQVPLKKLILAGLVCNVATFPFALYAYTGSALGDISFNLSSQGDVYTNRYRFLLAGEVGLIPTAGAAARSLLSPLIFGAIILGIRYWKRLSTTERLAVVAGAAIQFLFSFARGTDKEVLDLAIFAGAALLAAPKVTVSAQARRTVLSLAAVALLVAVFVGRREARSTSAAPPCFTAAQVCVDPDSSMLASVIGERGYLGVASATGYATQGYHGAELAAGYPHEWTYGLGSWPVLRRATGAAGLSFADDLSERTYEARIVDSGWDPRYSWSSLYTALANDVTFPLVPVVFLFLGWAFGHAWRRALDHHPAAYVTAVYLLVLLIYAPANNQIAVSLESMVSFAAWLVAWGLGLGEIDAGPTETSAEPITPTTKDQRKLVAAK